MPTKTAKKKPATKKRAKPNGRKAEAATRTITTATVTVEGPGAAKLADAIAAPVHPILRRTMRPLPCKLLDPELLHLGRQLSDALDEVASERERQKSVKQELAATLTRKEARVTELAMRLRRREEEREVSIEVRADYAAGKAYEVRLDTGDRILTRDLLPSERQPSLIPEPQTPEPAVPPEPASASEPDRCIECDKPVETSAAEKCPREGDLCGDGALHPGCVGPHADAHLEDDEIQDEGEDEPEVEDDEGEGSEAP